MQINAWQMVTMNFSSTHGHCSRKYYEVKNDFLSIIKMLLSAGVLAGHIPCLNAKDAKF